MSTEEELKAANSNALRRARIQSIVIGFSVVISILFMFYGFTQGIEAGRQRDIAEFQKFTCARELEEAKANLQRALTEVQLARAEAERQELAQQSAAKAKSKK